MSVARFIADQRTFYAVPHAFSCRLLEVSESWFYKWLKAPTTVRGERRALLDQAVRRAFVASKRSYGSPRIFRDLIDPELPHPELVAAQGAQVVALPVPTTAEEGPVGGSAEAAGGVKKPSPVQEPAAADRTAEQTPDPLPSTGSGCSVSGARWCGGCR